MRALTVILLVALVAIGANALLRQRGQALPPGTDAPMTGPETDRAGLLAATAVTVADNAFGDSVERAAELRDLLSVRMRQTYFSELLAAHDSMNYRWPDRRSERMRVWVQEVDAERRTLARRIVAEAFEDWAGSGIPIAFTVVPDSGRAEVHVTWVERFDRMITGLTHWTTNQDGWIVAARIELARRQSDGRALDSTSLAAIARHEVGHLLGLDHTADASNIMAARVTVSRLSNADRATIRLVYDLPPGRLPVP